LAIKFKLNQLSFPKERPVPRSAQSIRALRADLALIFIKFI